MFTSNNYKFILKMFFFTILGTCLVANTYAAAQTEKAKNTKQATKKELAIQDFKHPGIDIQFRYVEKKLVGIRFTNTSESSLKLSVFHDNYVLGPKDYILLNPPSVEYMHVRYHTETGIETTVGHIMKNRFDHDLVYKLPRNADSLVTKSDQKTPTD